MSDTHEGILLVIGELRVQNAQLAGAVKARDEKIEHLEAIIDELKEASDGEPTGD
jgi:hypothetical protein